VWWTDSLPRGLENILNKHKSDSPQTHTHFHSRCMKVGRNNNGADRMKSERRCARKRLQDPWGPIEYLLCMISTSMYWFLSLYWSQLCALVTYLAFHADPLEHVVLLAVMKVYKMPILYLYRKYFCLLYFCICLHAGNFCARVVFGLVVFLLKLLLLALDGSLKCT
jgi:hypothetical protein